jgi:acyl-CoA hydrolase
MNIAYVNDTAAIRTNPKMAAINSAIEVDITGQVCAFLYGKNMQERAKALINIAHPYYREMLEREAFERFEEF